jgi:hypothetical protein
MPGYHSLSRDGYAKIFAHERGNTMFRRLGIVAWWLGAIVLALTGAIAGYSWISNEIKIRDCPATMRLSEEIEKAHDVAVARYLREQPPMGEFQSALASAFVPTDPRATPSFLQDVEYCKHPTNQIFVLFISIVGVFAATTLWSLAFILGGAFWRPPKS